MIPNRIQRASFERQGTASPLEEVGAGEGARRFILLGTRRFCAEAISLTGCGVMAYLRSVPGAGEAGDERRRGLGHRQVARRRLRC